MKSLFYFSWFGNKRHEIKYIEPLLKKIEPETIVEPFCGSCALSLHYYINKEMTDIDYHVNDNDDTLINFLKYIDKTINDKTAYNTYIKTIKQNPTIDGYFFYNKVYSLRPGLFPMRGKKKEILTKYNDTDKFFKHATITNNDYTKILEIYKNDSKALIFLDPPYFQSFNQTYKTGTKIIDKQHNIIDTTTLYIDLLEFIKTAKCKVIMIINSNSILDHIKNSIPAHKKIPNTWSSQIFNSSTVLHNKFLYHLYKNEYLHTRKNNNS